jgi:hypothetical protein
VAVQSIPSVNHPSNDAVTALLAKIERAAQAAYPVCGKCGGIIQRGQLVDSTGSQHVLCPGAEPEDEYLRRLRG